MRHLLKLFIPAIAVSLLIAACGSSSSSNTSTSARSTQAAQASNNSASAAVVKTGSGPHGTILVDSQGMTLYHLSGEQNGKFICTGSCLGIWHPLVASSSATPGGQVGSLGTVKRPEGTLQVTYRGAPLYTFAQDKAPGETNGQGVKDVGTWSVLTTGSGAPSNASGSSEPENSGGGGANGGYEY